MPSRPIQEPEFIERVTTVLPPVQTTSEIIYVEVPYAEVPTTHPEVHPITVNVSPVLPESEKTYVYIPPELRKLKPEAEKPTAQKPKFKAEASTPVKRKPEEKARTEEKPSQSETDQKKKVPNQKRKKVKVYNGIGRRHKGEQIDQILDWYLMTGELPDYVSDRQRYSYKHHIKLPERRQLLEQAGLIPKGHNQTH